MLPLTPTTSTPVEFPSPSFVVLEIPTTTGVVPSGGKVYPWMLLAQLPRCRPDNTSQHAIIRGEAHRRCLYQEQQGVQTDQRSVDSGAYDGESVLAVHAVGLFTIINHHKVSDYGIRTIGTEGHSRSRAIRIDGIGPGARVKPELNELPFTTTCSTP